MAALLVAVAVLGLVGSAGGAERPASVSEPARSTQPAPDAAPQVRYPASYFSGPLGRRNPVPLGHGAFLLGWHGRHGWDGVKAGILERERAMGRRFDGIATGFVPSERRELWIHRRGAIPIIAGWTPGGTPQEIVSGGRDAAIRAFARYFKGLGFVVVVRMFHEFEMEHLPYHSCGQAYVDMWRHVVRVVQAEGATNVGFWWSPHEGYNRSCTTSAYPGDEYVDWVGADTYNHCYVAEQQCYATPYTPGWAEFGELFDYEAGFGNLVTQHDRYGPRKPFMVGETGTVFDPANPTRKGDWFRNVVAAAKRMQYLRGIMFFDVDASKVESARNNWHVDHPLTEPSAYRGFVQMARDPWFKTSISR